MSSCKFCYKFSSPLSSAEHKYDTIIYETENFVVTPTVGSLVEGWLLIISKDHFVSAGQLAESNFKELERLIEVAKQGLKDLKKQVFVFEHGPCSPSQSTGCGIDHLHYHVVPLEFNLFEKTKQYSPFIWNSATLLSTKEFFLKQRSYLYIQCPSGEKYIATDLNIPSQFFRRVIAKELNIENYFDWKQNFGTENIDKTIKILSNQLELT